MYEKLLNKYAINQLGYVVDDLEKAALAHSKLFGSGPFVHFTPPAPERTLFRGEEVKNTMEVAYGMYGDLQIELIKPTSSDPTPYTVPERKGFNHFSVWVDDFDAAVEDFEEAGFEVAMLMESSGGLTVWMCGGTTWRYIIRSRIWSTCAKRSPKVGMGRIRTAQWARDGPIHEG